MSEKYITVAQAAKLLGCPRSFLKSEIARGRIFTYRRGLRNKLKWESILMYRQETEGSQVWKDFLEAGYTPDPTVQEASGPFLVADEREPWGSLYRSSSRRRISATCCSASSAPCWSSDRAGGSSPHRRGLRSIRSRVWCPRPRAGTHRPVSWRRVPHPERRASAIKGSFQSHPCLGL